jgi:hypothetical protein
MGWAPIMAINPGFEVTIQLLDGYVFRGVFYGFLVEVDRNCTI